MLETMTSAAPLPLSAHRPRRRGVWVVLALAALPVLGFLALSTRMGLRMRDASAAAQRFCAAHPTGTAVRADARRRRGEAQGLQVSVSMREGGRGEAEACGGAMTASYCCTLTLEAGRVTSQRYARID
jgi:hypothetical protein